MKIIKIFTMIIVNGIKKSTHTELHKELKRKFGKASKCEMPNCIKKEAKIFQWALKKGYTYSSNREDYLQLCTSCHRKYDFTEQIRENQSKAKTGELNNRAKVTECQVLNILKLIKEGELNKSIAVIYGLDPSTISDIKRGKRWKHLQY